MLPHGRHPQLLDFRFLQTLRLGASILKPDLHLCLREVQRRRELGPLGDTQVLPLSELLLESQQLLGREGRSGLSVRLVLPQVALNLGRLAVLIERSVMRKMRREKRGSGRGRSCRGGCSSRVLMPATPDCVMKARRYPRDATEGGKTAEVGRGRPDGGWTGRVMLKILDVHQSALLVILDIVCF